MHTAVEPRLGGGEGGADLGGVMAVVVHHEHAPRLAPDLEAALHAREAGERLLDSVERHLEVEPHRDGGERVEHVVAARAPGSPTGPSDLPRCSTSNCDCMPEKERRRAVTSAPDSRP